MRKRVDFEVKATGTVHSTYVYVEERNVNLRNNKGFLLLEPRTEKYLLVFVASGRRPATVEVTATSHGDLLGKRKRTIGAEGYIDGAYRFVIAPE